MRRLLLAGVTLAIAALACAQETQVSKHPVHTVGGYSAHRYESQPRSCPPGGFEAAIPLVESKRIVDELVEAPSMSRVVENVTDEALYSVTGLNKEDVYVSLLEVCRESGGPPHFGHLNGNEPVYASGIANLFYATSLYFKVQQTGAGMSKTMRKNIGAMLHEGDYAAANWVVDYVSGTRSGDALPKPEFMEFAKKRSYTNWLFSCVGFQNFNVMQKLITGDPEGRDLQLLGQKLNMNYENSNRLTSNHAMALMYLLTQDAVVSKKASCEIKENIVRSVEQKKIGTLQGIAAGLPVGSKIWSVQGYTRQNFNEVAFVILPNNKAYVLSVMTRYKDYPTFFVPQLSRIFAHRYMTKTGDDTPMDGSLNVRTRAGE